MKTKTTLKHPAIRIYLLMAIAIVISLGFAPASRASLNPPYTPDFYTLHLWHLQDTSGTIAGVGTNAVYFYDSQSNNTQVVPLLISNQAFGGEYELAGQAGPGAPLVSLYGTNFGYPLAVQNTNDGGFIAPIFLVGSTMYPDLSYAETNDSCSFVNTNTGAFTWEALIQVGFNPLVSGGGIGDGSPEILCTDGANTTPPGANPYTVRAVQFRIDCASPSAGSAQLEFNGNISFSPSTQIHDVKANLPLTGPDALVQGNWYHVAAAFTGTAPTNGDPADVLTLYWTAFNPQHTNGADVLTNFYYFFTVTNTTTHTVFTQPYPSNSIVGGGPFVIGNIDRGLNGGWPGNIAEVRISDSYRHTNEFMFNTQAPPPSGPQITGPATNTLVGYGQNLTLTAQVQGGVPYVTEWYQVAGGVTNLLLLQTNNSSLVVSNIGYAANTTTYFATVTNFYGSATSAAATVTVGADFDGFFNTGCGTNDNPLDQSAPSSVDLHWMFPPGDNPYNNSLNCIVWSDAGPLSSGGGTVPPNGASVWIGPRANVASAGVTPGTYTFQTTFQVDETAVTTNTVISGTFGACGGATGNAMVMSLNGVQTSYTMSQNPDENEFAFNLTNGLQPGSNTLQCTVSLAGGDFAAFNMLVLTDIGAALTNAPVITNAPVGVTNVYGSTVSFQAVALGAPPLTYYWLSNGVAFTQPVWVGTALPYLSFVATNFSASQLTGTNYFANLQIVFSNFVGSVTNSVATVDIQLPPQTLVSAGVPVWDATNDETNIVVYFSQAVDPVSATTLGNYSLNNGASVLSAALGSAPGEVVLTTTVLSQTASYTLTALNVNSSLGVAMNPSPASVAVGTYPATVALWVKASQGVTTDATGTNVTQWNDLSGNGNNLMGYATFEPLLATNASNYPVIRFNGTNNGDGNFTYLYANDSPSLEITSNMSIFAVINFADLSGSTNGEIIGKTGLSPNNNIPAPYDYYATASASVNFLRGNGSVGAAVQSTGLPATGIPHLLDVVMNGTSVTHRLDGISKGTGTLSTTIADQGQPVYIGTRADAHVKLTGDMYELILIGSPLSSSDVASMESYLAAEYQLPIGVPPINANPTNLVFSVANGQLNLSWPADHTGWQLQAQTNKVSVGLGANWANFNPSTTTNQVTIPVNLTNGTVFYRLIYTP